METLTACPSCGSRALEHHIEVKDYSVSGEVFTIVKCTACGLLLTNPRPQPSELGQYYQSEDYVSHTNNGNNPVNLIYKLARTQTLRWKYNLIKKFNPLTILDFGCGTGHFLSYCKEKGLTVFGYEPDGNARSIAIKNVGESIVSQTEELNETYDVITMWHVLEHVSELAEVMKWLKKKLHPNGRLVIALPNHESLDAKMFNEYWAAYDVPRHLYHFSKDSLKALAIKYGFCLESMHPMKLDSFYVSLLSNKYRSGSIKPFNSFINGFKSNTYAKNRMNYSSVIYVLKHESL
ncbi:MAG: class I SAM-dependent methyltransferase [Cyclobacteriaceae bacterium]|nr:class I SAM-dependent methyltransferase [Cyclobacteriaceae bacterium]